MTGRGISRRRGRGRGGAVRRILRAVKKRDFEYRIFVPPVRQPTINRSFKFPFMCMTQDVYNSTVNAGSNGVSNMSYSIETVVGLVREAVDLPTDFNTRIRYQAQKIMVYGQFETTGANQTPVLNMVVFDPENGEVAKMVAAQGTEVMPARTGVEFPETVSTHVYGWDGTTGTSAPLIGVKTTQKIMVSVYFQGNVIINKDLLTAHDFTTHEMNARFARVTLETEEHLARQAPPLRNLALSRGFLTPGDFIESDPEEEVEATVWTEDPVLINSVWPKQRPTAE